MPSKKTDYIDKKRKLRIYSHTKNNHYDILLRTVRPTMGVTAKKLNKGEFEP